MRKLEVEKNYGHKDVAYEDGHRVVRWRIPIRSIPKRLYRKETEWSVIPRRKVTLARHTQENGVEHGDLEPSWRSPTRRVYTSGRPDRIVPINPSEHRQQPRVT